MHISGLYLQWLLSYGEPKLETASDAIPFTISNLKLAHVCTVARHSHCKFQVLSYSSCRNIERRSWKLRNRKWLTSTSGINLKLGIWRFWVLNTFVPTFHVSNSNLKKVPITDISPVRATLCVNFKVVHQFVRQLSCDKTKNPFFRYEHFVFEVRSEKQNPPTY